MKPRGSFPLHSALSANLLECSNLWDWQRCRCQVFVCLFACLLACFLLACGKENIISSQGNVGVRNCERQLIKSMWGDMRFWTLKQGIVWLVNYKGYYYFFISYILCAHLPLTIELITDRRCWVLNYIQCLASNIQCMAVVCRGLADVRQQRSEWAACLENREKQRSLQGFWHSADPTDTLLGKRNVKYCFVSIGIKILKWTLSTSKKQPSVVTCDPQFIWS